MIGYHLERGSSFENGLPRSTGWENFGRRWTKGVGVLNIGQFLRTLYVYYPIINVDHDEKRFSMIVHHSFITEYRIYFSSFFRKLLFLPHLMYSLI